MRASFVVFAAIGVAVSLPSQSHAQAYKIESRLAHYSPKTLRPFLEKGQLALVESDGDQVKQTIMFALIDAPPSTVYDLLMDVASYPKFIRTIADTRITRRKKGMLEYRWKLQVPLISLGGTRLQRGRRPSLVEVRGTKGNFRRARERWELHALDGGKKTLAAFYRTLDAETGGLVIETLHKLEPTFGQALSLATSYVHMRAVMRQAKGEKQKRPDARTGAVPPFRDIKKGFSLEGLRPLMKLGKLALIESHPDGALSQVAMMTIVRANKDRIFELVNAPQDYPKFIPNFAEQTAEPLADGTRKLKWELEVPFTNLYGTSIMYLNADRSIDVVNQSGDVPRGRFKWDFGRASERETVLIHYQFSDVRQASFFTRQLTKKEPLFEHGAVIASTAVALSAVKSKAEGLR